jgi:hypothetical protein
MFARQGFSASLDRQSNKAGYEEIAERIDQQAIANHLTRLEREIIAKY